MHEHFASESHMSRNINSISKFGQTPQPPLTHFYNTWTLPNVIKKEIENYRKDYFENTFNDTEDSYNAWWTVWNREDLAPTAIIHKKEIHMKWFLSL